MMTRLRVKRGTLRDWMKAHASPTVPDGETISSYSTQLLAQLRTEGIDTTINSVSSAWRRFRDAVHRKERSRATYARQKIHRISGREVPKTGNADVDALADRIVADLCDMLDAVRDRTAEASRLRDYLRKGLGE